MAEDCHGHGHGHGHGEGGHGHGHGHGHGDGAGGHRHGHEHGECGHVHGHGHGHTAGAPTPEPEKGNSPACGHVAIKFDDKIAITRPDGELDVFTLPDGSSVDELCFCPHDELVERQQSDCCEDPDCGSQMIIPERRECCDHSEAHVHAHLRSDCERGLRGTDLARNRVTLTKQVVEPSELLTPPEAQPTATVTVIRHGDCDHTDGPGCGGQKIRHGDHFDYRVEQEHGTKELHHPYKDERGVQRCVGHGVLRPNNELIGGSWRGGTFSPSSLSCIWFRL